jgi:hypothetical protein
VYTAEVIMSTRSEIMVTLSDELLDALQSQARLLRVPLRWMVASLVCDTIEMAGVPIPLAADARLPGRA